MDPMQQTTPANTPEQASPQPPAKKKPWLAPLAAILVVAALAVGGLMWWNNMSNQNAEETPAVAISVTGSGFSPETVTIKKGQDVTWTNQTHVAQKLVGAQNKPQGLATAEPLNFGDSYSFTFEDAGTYSYYNPLRTDQKGTIVVE